MTENNLIVDQMIDENEGLTPTRQNAVEIAEKMMEKELRSWGKWMLFWGVFNLVLSGYNGGFGIILLIIGLAALRLPSAAMFIVLGVSMAWAAVSNLLSIFLGGGFEGIIWTVIQVFFAFRLFQKFSQYRPVKSQDLTGDFYSYGKKLQPGKAARLMPWGALLAGGLAILGFGASLLVSIIWFGFIDESGPPQLLYFLTNLFLEIGVLGFALGLASWLSGFRNKLLSGIGMASGMLVLFVMIAFALIG